MALRGASRDLTARRQLDRLMKSLGATPQVLCWNCRRMTVFEAEHCEHCGSAFAGSTGGAYGSGRVPQGDPPRRAQERSGLRARSLSEIVEDLQRVRELAYSPGARAAAAASSRDRCACPTCGRFVSESASQCVCGARFAPASVAGVVCPECEATVPAGKDACPVCGVVFRGLGPKEDPVYACPRCGTQVTADAFRCTCGARFAD